MDFDVGERLKLVRRKNNMSQRQLAKVAGVTSGMISLIESNKTSPSVSSLKKILSVLGMTLSQFFGIEEQDSKTFVYRAMEFVEISPSRLFKDHNNILDDTLSLRRVSNAEDSELLMLHETYEPGADTGPEPYSHVGEEAGFVVEGELLLTVGKRTESLGPGDAYQFNSTLPHRFRNVSENRCVVISACTPPTF